MARIILAQNIRDRRRALAFVRYHVRQRYGGIPPPSQILFFAEYAGRICGTIALDFAGSEEEFPLEVVYKMDHSQTPWAFKREEVAQFSKWWTTRPGVAVQLMHIAHLHALAQGKRFGLVEVKPNILEHVGGFGMSLKEVPGAILQIRGISSRGEGYYHALPPPRLYMFDIALNASALEHYLNLVQGR